MAELVLVAVTFYLAGLITGRYLIPPVYDLVCRIRGDGA